MFTQHIPRAGEPVGNARQAFTRAGAAFGVVALSAGLGLVAPLSASADEVATSYAQAQFLSGTLAGTDLANVAALQAAEARNNGQQDKQTSKDPLDATVVQAVDIQSPNGIQTSLGSFLDAGVVNQYAEADKNGKSLGAAGAAGDDGAIGVGSVGNGAAGDLDLDLEAMLQGQFSSVLSDLKLSLNAVSAQAVGDKDVATGDYTLDGAKLTFTSPAIAGLGDKVGAALGTVDSRLAGLGGENGSLSAALGGILDPVLAAAGSSAHVTATVTSDADAAVQSLLTGSYGNNGVSFDLQTGKVTVDLAALQGGDLNNLPVNTELLSDSVMKQVLKSITDTVSTLADQIVNKVSTSLHNAQVAVHADLDVLGDQPPVMSNVCHDEQVPVIGDLPVVGGLLGGLLGGSSPGKGIVGYTVQSVCELVGTVAPAVHSTANVDVNGTVDQIIGGLTATTTGSISLLDGTVQVPVDVTGILGGLGTTLTDGLFDSNGAVTDLTNSLQSGLVDPALTGLLGDNGVGTALTDVLSVRVNLQELSLASQKGMAVNTGQLFTETAVRVSALRGAGSTGLATVNVAAATVGPNITTVVTPPGCTTNCGPGGNPDPCVANCTNGNPGTPSTAATRLAMTGVGIATLIAIILALLAAGAYLAREGYRRNHPRSAKSAE